VSRTKDLEVAIGSEKGLIKNAKDRGGSLETYGRDSRNNRKNLLQLEACSNIPMTFTVGSKSVHGRVADAHVCLKQNLERRETMQGYQTKKSGLDERPNAHNNLRKRKEKGKDGKHGDMR